METKLAEQLSELLSEYRLYLQSKGHQVATIKSHVYVVRRFMSWLKLEGLSIKSLGYGELLKWIGWNQGRGLVSETINRELLSLEYFYGSMGLSFVGQGLRLRGRRHRLPRALLSEEDLHGLYEVYQEGGLCGKRNKVLLGMLIWQGLRGVELSRLRVEDIDLDRALMRIKEGSGSNSRILDLSGEQMLCLEEYLYRVRPLLELDGVSSDHVFLSLQGRGGQVKDMLIRLTRYLGKKGLSVTARQLRQSVISNWLSVYDLREVQYRSGHRYVSSTYRYSSGGLEDLQDRLEQLHPLNGH